MEMNPVGRLSVPDVADPRSNIGKKAGAAEEFEALLIGQLLKSAREAGSGSWLGEGEDQSSTPALEFAEQQLATLLAKSGGLGLAKLVAKGMEQQAAAAVPVPVPPAK